MANAYYWSSPYAEGDNNTDIRSLGSELNAAMLASGLVQTSDTGQVNWGTVTVPGSVSTLYGYEVWSILGGALCVRIEWYSPSNLAGTFTPRFKYIIGTGSDGSGNITGVIFTSTLTTANNTLSSGNKPSYISNPSSGDFFGLVYKVGGVTSGGSYTPSALAFCIEKTVDGTGAPDGFGYVITCHDEAVGGASGLVSAKKAVWVIATGMLYALTNLFCIVPRGLTDSSVGTDKQAFVHQVAANRVRLSHGVCTVVASEALPNTTFNICVVGDPVSATRGYVSVGYGIGGSHAGSSSNTYSCAILWEP